MRQESLDDGAVHGWQVATYDKPARRGWIPSSAITEFGQRVSELQATAVSLQAERLPASEIDTLPELILRQQNREIQTAWREIAIAVEENQKLPESERLPEPYFARAEIWAAVDNYSDSLQDYLTAIRYARQSGRDLLSYSDYFQRMYNVAEELEKMPVSAAGAESNAAAAAVKHYGAGLHRYFAGDIPAALAHFDNAVQLSPNKAIYWYLRGLTHRRVGDHARAQYDVLMGAAFEKTLPSWKQRALNGQLIRIQGESRQWLEAFRLGAAKNQLPNSPLIDASISRANP
ncbi:hypothetical protein DSM3645_28557 [Blastopirellula marina DSM 3645]|uniref:Tetratricopeptide repeat protein n=1 Tax=Blastopirellula marina DSM 3645 TaxID=314230 RepID=A3ZPD3_9BACT|nr:hypothetical protein DSM3645_28557 [Blastopirellula marina DSM 3645]